MAKVFYRSLDLSLGSLNFMTQIRTSVFENSIFVMY